MSREIGVGIIGCGGRVRGLARNLVTRYGDVKVVALCDTSQASIEAARRDLNPDARVYDHHRELCAARDLEWVIVGSYNACHREHAVAALEAGKHVFCEKPLATRIEDCVAIRDAVRASGRIFSFGLTLRYAGLYRRIHDLVTRGAIGKLISMEFNENLEFNHGGFIHADWRRHTRDAGSHVLEKCCHDIDLANWFVGSRARRAASFGGTDFFVPENEHHVQRIGKNRDGVPAYSTWLPAGASPFTNDKDIVDNQVAILEYENRVRATFHTNCHAGIPERRMLLLGSEGAIRADLVGGVVEHRRVGWDEPLSVYRDAGGGHGDGDHHLVSTLYASMLNGEPPRAGISEAMDSAVTCFGIDRALETGSVVDLAPLWANAGT
jgi:predicted dehydrogenase